VASQKYSIGIVEFAASEVTSEAIINKYLALAKAKNWTVTTANSNGSVDQAISAIQNFVQKKVNLIIVGVFASTSLTGGLKAAKAAGIPVATISGGIADGITLNLAVPDGLPVAQLLVKDLGGKGHVLVLGYTPGLPCQLREKALMATLKGTSISVEREEVKIPGQVESGQTFAQSWLAKHPAGSGPLAIWACFDDPALGALVALKQAKRTDVKLYGYDGTAPSLKAIEAGQFRATYLIDPNAAAQTFVDQTPGVISAGPAAAPRTLPLPYTLISSDNIGDYLKAHPSAS
jgi:ribose transport system substrate-binding protein